MVCLKEAVSHQLMEVVSLRLKEVVIHQPRVRVMVSHQLREAVLVSKRMGYSREKAWEKARVWIRVASV